MRQIDQNHVERINQISDTNNHDIVSPLEGITLQNPNIQGGSGFSAATVADLGFEPTDGATHIGAGVSGGKRPRTRPKAKARGSGISGGALLTDQNAEFDLRPQPGDSVNAVVAMPSAQHKNQPIPQASNGPTINGPLGVSGSNDITGSGVSGGGVSGGGVSGGGVSGGGVSGGTKRRSNARNDLVRSIMKEKNMSLPQASKYIKENNLYTK